jgi:hypothetical protein
LVLVQLGYIDHDIGKDCHNNENIGDKPNFELEFKFGDSGGAVQEHGGFQNGEY